MSDKMAMYSSGASSHFRSEAAESWTSPDLTRASWWVSFMKQFWPEFRENYKFVNIVLWTFW
jgi:hypothetical protein